MLCQAMTSPPALPEWKEPTQARSRARVEAFLNAARDLAIEAGHLDLKMTEIAARAGAPIGSLYQFFPNRTSLLARLFTREMGPIDDGLRAGLNEAASIDEIIRGIGGLIRTSHTIVKKQPALLVIWTSPAMDPAIQLADFQGSEENARLITERAIALSKKPVDEKALYETALLICHLWGHTIRLSALMEERAPDNTVLEQFIAMIERQCRGLLEPARRLGRFKPQRHQRVALKDRRVGHCDAVIEIKNAIFVHVIMQHNDEFIT